MAGLKLAISSCGAAGAQTAGRGMNVEIELTHRVHEHAGSAVGRAPRPAEA